MSKSSKKRRQATKRRKELEKVRGLSLLDDTSPVKPLESSPDPTKTSHLKISKKSSIDDNKIDHVRPKERSKADTEAAKKPEPVPFGNADGLSNTRKEIEFVLPRSMGKAERYIFDKQTRERNAELPTIPEEKTPGDSVLQPKATKRETLDDILFSNKKRRLANKFEAVYQTEQTQQNVNTALATSKDTQEAPQSKAPKPTGDSEAPSAPVKKPKPKKRRRRSNSMGETNDEKNNDPAHVDSGKKLKQEEILSDPSQSKNPTGQRSQKEARSEMDMVGRKMSGRSVEQAVKDRSGLRPRANSTDGELNLPQRGLCDEQTVLRAHKWEEKQNYVHQATPRGFVNLGNTCFMNSIIQCLAYSPPFCQTLIAISETKEKCFKNGAKPKLSPGQRITSNICNLFQKVHSISGLSMNGGSIAPQALVKMLPSLGSIGSRNGYKFWPGRQEDAHEFLVHLLDAMHDGELQGAGINQHMSGWRDRLPVDRLDETTFIHRIFGGYFRSQVRCKACGYCSNTYDPFLDLSLEVSKKSSSILHAISEFTRKETLDAENQWKCSGCKRYVCPTKQLTVFRPPLCLCIQLKRFSFDGLGTREFSSFATGRSWKYGKSNAAFRGRSKITRPVDFPADLNVPLSDGRSCAYALTGVVVHVGGSASSGHYTAYVKKPGEEGRSQWYYADDNFVEPVSEKTALRQKNAYILFYCRKEVKLEFPAPPTRDMSADEAKEFGRARAKARAGGSTKREEDDKIIKESGTAEDGPVRRTKAAIHPLAEFLNKTMTKQFRTSMTPVPKVSNQASSPVTRTSSACDDRDGSTGTDKKSANSTVSPTERGDTSALDSSKAKPEAGNAASNIPVKADKWESDENFSSTDYESNDDEVPSKYVDSTLNSIKSPAAASTEKKHPESSEESSGDDRMDEYPDKIRPQERESTSACDEEKSQNVLNTHETSSEDDLSSNEGNSSEEESSRNGETGLKSDPTTQRDSISKNESDTNDNESDSCENESENESAEAAKARTNLAKSVAKGGTEIESRTSAHPKQEENKTRVVVGSFNSREKVKVMLGPRNRKTWEPKTAPTTQKGAAFQLLGNRGISRWDEDEDESPVATSPASKETTAPVANEREQIVKRLEKQETCRKRKSHLDRWDALLDQGKVKKVKKNPEEQDSNMSQNPKKNVFQRIQCSVQRMNRGKAKGLFRRKATKVISRKNGR